MGCSNIGTGSLVGIVSLMYTSQYMGNPIYHASGGIAALTGVLSDYISTYRCIEKGQGRLMEAGPVQRHIIGEFPEKSTLLSFKMMAMQVFGIALATIIPPLGYGLLVHGNLQAYDNYGELEKVLGQTYHISK